MLKRNRLLRSAIAASLIAAAQAAAAAPKRTSPIRVGPIKELRPAKVTGYFERNYETARERFRSGATLLDKELRAAGHPGATIGHVAIPGGNGATIDYVYVPATDKKKSLVAVVSGTHGLEGPVGSAQQSLMLSQKGFLEKFDFRQHGLLLIHSLNPTGWVHDTRETPAGNVDLNRAAWVTKAEDPKLYEEQFKNPAWERGKSLVMFDGPARGGRWGTAWQIGKRFFSLLRHHQLKTSDLPAVLGRGQNQDARGIAYMGGPDRPTEIRALRDLAGRILPGYDNVLFADVHSGIGAQFPTLSNLRPSRDGWIFTNTLATPQEEAKTAALFGASGRKHVKVQLLKQQEYTDQGDTTMGIERLKGMEKKNLISVTIEHATSNFPAPGLAERVNELRGRFNGYAGGERAEQRAKAQLRQRFVPTSRGWQKNAIANMEAMNERMADFLDGAETLPTTHDAPRKKTSATRF
jgi:hypothetical protein